MNQLFIILEILTVLWGVVGFFIIVWSVAGAILFDAISERKWNKWSEKQRWFVIFCSGPIMIFSAVLVAGIQIITGLVYSTFVKIFNSLK